ncbi:MotA/TolQ/ExbB proton channel family protein [Vibrio parahaemolyticus]|uniref:MotA/TolQ/ExbB proton channel family protein n=1 Tax=Vibrio parahaemolyticus TaxID=670 RepID=UPI001E29BB09|nr:MotA/TolQ/ExbB proton channel family protein [Vibrio parahaemolyticus]MCD1416905.1 MotA/TolQ/ExbB proton channel family protein [Vibrio parahaemolyticus]
MTFFKSGGVFMYPIAIVGLLALALVIERFIMMTKYRQQILRDTRAFNRQIEQDKEVALSALQAGTSVLSDTVREAVTNYRAHSVSKEEFEELMSINAIGSVRRLTRRTTVISTLANVATLLGLLGTIMGLIQSFATVAQATGDKSALLSASVSVAMNTTAFGLMVAIPLLLIYVMIDNTSSKAIESLQMGCATVMNKLYQKRA